MSHFLDLVIGVDDEGTDDEYTYIESSTWTCEADDKALCLLGTHRCAPQEGEKKR